MVNCPVCAGPISAGSVTIEGKQYHPKCFTCKKCNAVCRVTFFQIVNGKFYCQNCVDKNPDLYHAVRNSQKVKIEEATRSTSTENSQPQYEQPDSSYSRANPPPKKAGGCILM